MTLAHTGLPRCPVCGYPAFFGHADSIEFPFEVKCGRPGCPVLVAGNDEEYVVKLWKAQAAIPRDGVEAGFEIVNFDKREAPTPPKDPRLRGLVDALHEIEGGGPSGRVFATWGPTKMRDRAREALVAAGLFREPARRRFEREQHNRLQAGRYDE